MADTGLVLCGTGASITGSGTDWDNPTNITAEDSNSAYADLDKNGGLSDYLRGTNLGFSVPTGATIDGIEVQINKEPEGDLQEDEFVYLVENGSVISGCDNKAKTGKWTASTRYTETYGGSSDTWNCSLTPSVVNSSSFGVQIMAEHPGVINRRWVKVYWIKIKVYYTEAAGGTTYQATVVSAGVGSANADTRVAERAESGSGGTGSANANAKASKSANGGASGIGNASAGAKLARRVECGSDGTGGASSGARVSMRAEGGSNGSGNADAAIRRCSRADGAASGVGAANASALHVVNQVTAQSASAGSGDADAEAKIASRAEGSADGSGYAGVDVKLAWRVECGSDGAASANANAKAVKLVAGGADGGAAANADVHHFLKAQYVEGLSEGESTASAVAKKVLRIEAAAAGVGVTKSVVRTEAPSVSTPVRSTANDMIPPLSQQVVDPDTGFPTKPLADFLFYLANAGYDDSAILAQIQAILGTQDDHAGSITTLLNSIQEEANARIQALQTLEQRVEDGDIALTRKIDFYKAQLNYVNASITQIQQTQVSDQEALAKAVQTLAAVSGDNTITLEEVKEVSVNNSSKQAVNYVAYSEDFSQPEWSSYYDGVTILSSTETGPNGETNATKLQTNASAQSNTGVFNVPGLTLDLNEVYTASIWLKSDTGGETVNIGFGTGGVGTSVTLSTSWKRYIVTATPDNGSFLGRIFVLTAAPNTTFYAFGAQLNRGNAADDYITTHGEPGLDLGGISSYAKYAIEINANGRISGFKVIGTETRTDFIVEADNFAVKDPDAGSGDFTLQVEGGKVKVNGNLIVNGSVGTAQITDDAVTNVGFVGSTATVDPYNMTPLTLNFDYEGGQLVVIYTGVFASTTSSYYSSPVMGIEVDSVSKDSSRCFLFANSSYGKDTLTRMLLTASVPTGTRTFGLTASNWASGYATLSGRGMLVMEMKK